MGKFSDESVQLALRGRFLVRTYPFPGAQGVEVAVKLLSDAELDSVRLEAVEFAKKKKAELIADPEFLDRVIHRETVSRAFYDPASKEESFFSSQAEVAELDSMTVRSLYELYISHSQSMDPYAHVPKEDIEELADILGKSESSVGLLNLYDAETLRSLLLSMGLRLRETLQTLKWSTGGSASQT